MERRNIITRINSVKPNMMESSLMGGKMVMVIMFMGKVNILALFSMDLCMIRKAKFKLKI